MRKQVFFQLLGVFVLLSFAAHPQGVGIGPGTFTPNASAGLHVSFPDKGILLPQVDLGTYLTTLDPGAHGLMVYNINGSALSGKGFYINTGDGTSPKWQKVTLDVDGSGPTNSVAFWTSGTILGGNSNLYWDNSNQRLGIGTSAPAQQLSITQNLQLSSASSASAGTIYKGDFRFLHNYGTFNLFAGVNAGNFTLTGTSNVGLGANDMELLTTGANNTAVGDYALPKVTTGEYNTAIGSSALAANQTTSSNIAIGNQALFTQTSGAGEPVTANIAIGDKSLYANNPVTSSSYGHYNTAVGHNTLRYNTTGRGNVALGYKAMFQNQAGSNCTAIGNQALYSQSSEAGFNTAVGCQALYSNNPSTETNGVFNTGIGGNALKDNTDGYWNTATGYNCLTANTTGYYNTGAGMGCLVANITGNFNTGAGTNALSQNVSGNRNVGLGYYAGPSGDGLSNTVSIGSSTLATASNQVRLGDENIQSFYCQGAYFATTGNAANLYVASNGQIMRSTAKSTSGDQISDLEKRVQAHEAKINELVKRLDERDALLEKLQKELEEMRRMKD